MDMEGENQMSQTANSKVLATMTHIDGPGYGASIRDAVNEHIKYHSMHSEQTISNSVEDCKESCSYVENACNGMIKMSDVQPFTIDTLSGKLIFDPSTQIY